MEPMRINRYLAACGLGSRRKCEELILAGKVLLNGKRLKNLATQIGPQDEVAVDGKILRPATVATIILHKPPGVLCTKSDPKGRPTIYDLLPPPLQNLNYVGRLDMESEGLLIMTNDGDLNQKLTHPSHKVEKEYWVALHRPYDAADTAKMRVGIQLEDGVAQADAVTALSPRNVSIVVHQGLNRQVRFMLEALDYAVLRLVRVRIGGIDLGTLKPGKWKHLHAPDLERLFSEKAALLSRRNIRPEIRQRQSATPPSEVKAPTAAPRRREFRGPVRPERREDRQRRGPENRQAAPDRRKGKFGPAKRGGRRQGRGG